MCTFCTEHTMRGCYQNVTMTIYVIFLTVCENLPAWCFFAHLLCHYVKRYGDTCNCLMYRHCTQMAEEVHYSNTDKATLMKISPVKAGSALAVCAMLALAGCSGSSPNSQSGSQQSEAKSYSTREVTDGKTTFIEVTNPNGGATLSYSADSGIELLEVEEDGYTYAFKNMDGSDELSPWEDWRLSAKERASDLAPQLTTEQIAGLMLFSSHERAPGDGLTDAQKKYLKEDNLRNVLNAGSSNVKDNVQWSNEMQAYVEALATPETPYIPANFSSDPRSDATGTSTFIEAGSDISKWPSSLGLAATFDPETVRAFGEAASQEYRALGIATALSPQIDVASEPRWLRISGTFGENPEMVAEMAAAYVDGFQKTSDGTENEEGWGEQSVSAMIKHFPGDGAGEGGRESHTNAGKYAVFPGGAQDEHLKPFMSALDAAAVMTSYSIDLDGEGNPLYGEAVGSAYDKQRIDILRKDNNYDGVLVTDWGITAGGETDPDAMFGMPWGVEGLTVDERHYAVLQTGIDMFGGNNAVAPVMAAYDLWQADFESGKQEISADERFQQTAVRVLTMLFQSGLYDNPYLELESSEATVGSQDKVDAGKEAQLDSVVVLKNNETISCSAENPWADKTVYIPRSYDLGFDGLFGPGNYTEAPTLDLEVAEKYFAKVVTDEVELDENEQVVKYTAPDLSDVDVTLVGMASPNNGNPFTSAGMDLETGEFYPLSLQYRPYTADGENVRKTSIGGDVADDGTKENRSYFGKTSRIANEADLDAFERAVNAVKDSGKDIPVITVLKASNPTIPAEFEKDSSAIVTGFGVSDEALFEVALGLHDAKGRLPIAFPANMDTVEANSEDVSGDIDPYIDSNGNAYEYGFGLSCSGKID